MTIRPCTAADLPAVLRLFYDAVHTSRAARAFFAHRGYRLAHAQQVALRGQTLENFVMEKELI